MGVPKDSFDVQLLAQIPINLEDQMNDQTWTEQHQAKLEVAIKRWHDLIMFFPDECEVKQVLCASDGVSMQLAVLKDVLNHKSPLTLIQRANSFDTDSEG